MTTIGLVQQKGGVGKTTIATNLAATLQSRGYSALLVDADPQGTARDWAAKSEDIGLTTVGVDRPVVHEELPSIEGFDVAIVDAVGKLEKMTISVIKASDLALVPIQPSAADLWAVGQVIDHIESRQEITGGKPEARFVISRAIASSTMTDQVQEILNEAPFERLETEVNQRVAYARALGDGKSIHETSDAKAKKEINDITDELEQILQTHGQRRPQS
ncbi:ParA family partition ATPase [Salinibacter ruber]|uniref:ParA family partition ATPase n=1 Tax=Salinibacter ruber TaxID=146919 RepID=UPI002166E564|nr:ParA family partition ATPase [Salinibacter ruber]MCS4054068.1 chromosome partitioning protein [Salinibacter ruber]